MRKVNYRIWTVISLLIGIIPPCTFLFFTASLKYAIILSLIISASVVISRGIHYIFFKITFNSILNTIRESVQNINHVQEQLEKMTLELVDIMGRILKKTTEGSDEAKAVVEYFIGISQNGKSTFGDSYITQMIHRNELVLKKTSILFKDIEKINTKLMEQVEQTANKIGGIYQFVSEINKIAVNTRILALNAMIEAARAGEHAAGFTVVAEEVKKMADHSDRTALQIANIAEDSINLMSSLKQEMEIRINQGLTGMQSVEKDLVDTFGILKTGIDNISEAIGVVTLNYQAIAKDIKGVIVSLQYQDITTQELEKVISELSALTLQFQYKQIVDQVKDKSTVNKTEPTETIKDKVTFFE